MVSIRSPPRTLRGDYDLCSPAASTDMISTPKSQHWRRIRVLIAVAVLVVGATATVFVLRRTDAAPVPPDATGANLEPAVVAAVRDARTRVMQEPTSGERWGRLGQVFLANELEEEGRRCLAEAERLAAANPRWPYLQGGIFLNRGERETAVLCLQRAVERAEVRDESNTAPRLLLAETLMTLGRTEEADSHIRRALDLHPEDPRAHFDQGLLAIARQDWPAARDHLSVCLGSPFARRKARVQLAVICQRLGDAAGAETFRAEAQRLPADTEWVDPYLNDYLVFAVKERDRYRLAENLEAAGHFAEAASVLAPLAAARSDDDLAHMTLGKVLAQMGRLGEAEQALRRAVQLAPHKVQTHYYLGLVLLQEGERLRREEGGKTRGDELLQEAVSSERRALAIKPDYGFAHMALGLALKQLGQRAEAVDALRQAVRCNPEFGEMHFYLGEALVEDGRTEEARPRLERALRLAPPEAGWRQTAETRLAEVRKSGSDKKK
jgi:tetratricopeptide (TPR) repeat protein